MLVDFQPVPERIPKPLHDLVDLIMVKNPDERPRFAFICAPYDCY